jgi:diguanylate cyclase (GGDEF)-like protein
VDFVARYGGEEFLIMMPETEIDAAVDVAERIRTKLAAEPLPAGRITLSMGVAAFPAHGDGAEALISAADRALYDAKRAGRDRVAAAGRRSVPA